MATITVDISADLQYVTWSKDDQGNWSATGQVQWNIEPTRLIIPENSGTIEWNLARKNGNDKGDVTFATTNPISWKAASPGTVTRDSDTKCSMPYDNSNVASTSTDWAYTINAVLTKEGTSYPLQYDPDVENESTGRPS
jgi:hypothetical protein